MSEQRKPSIQKAREAVSFVIGLPGSAMEIPLRPVSKLGTEVMTRTIGRRGARIIEKEYKTQETQQEALIKRPGIGDAVAGIQMAVELIQDMRNGRPEDQAVRVVELASKQIDRFNQPSIKVVEAGRDTAIDKAADALTKGTVNLLTATVLSGLSIEVPAIAAFVASIPVLPELVLGLVVIGGVAAIWQFVRHSRVAGMLNRFIKGHYGLLVEERKRAIEESQAGHPEELYATEEHYSNLRTVARYEASDRNRILRTTRVDKQGVIHTEDKKSGINTKVVVVGMRGNERDGYTYHVIPSKRVKGEVMIEASDENFTRFGVFVEYETGKNPLEEGQEISATLRDGDYPGEAVTNREVPYGPNNEIRYHIEGVLDTDDRNEQLAQQATNAIDLYQTLGFNPETTRGIFYSEQQEVESDDWQKKALFLFPSSHEIEPDEPSLVVNDAMQVLLYQGTYGLSPDVLVGAADIKVVAKES